VASRGIINPTDEEILAVITAIRSGKSVILRNAA
jgi:hypothetical protein